MVDTEIAQLGAAGIRVVPFLRSSDEIGTMSLPSKALLPISPIWAPSAQRDLAALLDAERPDVLHLHNPYPLLSPWVVRTAHQHGVPVVQTIHNYRHVCVAATFYRDGAICHDCVGKRVATPAITHACYRGSRAQSVIMATALAAHRGTWHSVDRFIALTTGIADYLREYGIAEDRITIKPNAIDNPGEPPAGSGAGFLFVGRLSPEKGLGLLLDAWRRHPDGSLGTLRIIGDGPERPLAESAAAARADIEFLGPRDPSAVRATMRDSAVVIAPSTWHDVLPTVIIEALANARPVLGTNLGGIPYLIGSAGWVVPATVDALADALPIARDEAPTLGGAARDRYLATFSPERVLDKLIGVYRDTVATGRR